MYPLSFEEYGLSPEIVNGLADVRIEKPTSLQQEVLPAVLKGKNAIVKNTSSDVSTFLIPALHKAAEQGESSGTQVLILTPSIERAAKIDEMVWAIGYHAQISSALLEMKGDKAAQEQALLDGAPVIVANPGRLIELLENHKFRLQQLKLLIIDEAHNMENFNLVNRVKEILNFVDAEPQVIILAEKENNATQQLVELTTEHPEVFGFERNGTIETEHKEVSGNSNEPIVSEDPEEISVSGREESIHTSATEVEEAPIDDGSSALVPTSEQGYINVPPRMKISTLMAHLETSKANKVVVFAASSRTTDRLFRIIRKKNWGVVSIGDDIDQQTYDERFSRFIENNMRVLLVGGLAANTVSIDQADELINYDVPADLEEYRYRAELVKEGKALQMISLVSKMDRENIKRISEEAGYPPVELPFPKELIDKKKKNRARKPGQTKKEHSRKARYNPPRKSNRANLKKKPARKKAPQPKTLPRPSYDGLSGGREGNKGLLGWVKKLFR